MAASLQLPSGFLTLNPRPEISRYYNNAGATYTDTSQVISEVVLAARYVGQTFLIGTVEYWFSPTTANADLVLKQPSNIVTGTGTNNKVPKWNTISGLVDSTITDNGSLITLGVSTAVVGSITANSFIRLGGLSTQFLKADGSIDSNIYLTSEVDTLQLVTSRGNVTTTSIQANSFIKTGGLSTEYLKADGSVSLLTNPVTGTGTVNKVTKWSSSSNIIDSTITDTGSLITLGSDTTLTTGNITHGLTLVSERHAKLSNATSSTGLYEFGSGGITQNTTTTVNIGNVKGWIIDPTNVLNTNPIEINYPGATNVAIPGIGANPASYYLIKPDGTLLIQYTRPTVSERRNNIFLGVAGHPAGTLTGIGNSPDITMNVMSQVRAMFEPTRFINEGIAIGANGVNLALANTAGTLYGLGIGFVTMGNSAPSTLPISAGAPMTTQYRTSVGIPSVGGTDRTTAVPDRYESGGVDIAIPGSSNQATNQRFYLLQNGAIRIQYGQVLYATLADAIAGVSSETFVVNINARNLGILIGILAITKGATDLSNTAQARFLPVSKFGETVGAAAGIAVGNLQVAYNNSGVPNIITNNTLGALTVRRGSAADTDSVFSLQNGAGTTNFSVNGNGDTALNGLLNQFTTKVLPAGTTSTGSTFNLTSTNSTSNLLDRDNYNMNEDGISYAGNITGKQIFLTNNKTTNQLSSTVIPFSSQMVQANTSQIAAATVVASNFSNTGSGAIGELAMFKSFSTASNPSAITNFYGLFIFNSPQNNVTNSKGVLIPDLFGTAISRGIDSQVTSGSGKFNIYAQGTANNYFNGEVQIGTTTASGAKLTVGGSINAATAIARGTYLNNTLVATANNDVLIGLDVNATYTIGAFTGVTNIAIRSAGDLHLLGNVTTNTDNVRSIGSTTFNFAQVNARNLVSSTGNLGIGTNLTNADVTIFAGGGSVKQRIFGATGNIVLQNGGTFTDAGYRLDVQGTTRLSSTLTLGTTPTTSAGTYDIITRNTSTGVIEKIASSSIVTGTGTTNYLPKWTSGSALGTSKIRDNGNGEINIFSVDELSYGFLNKTNTDFNVGAFQTGIGFQNTNIIGTSGIVTATFLANGNVGIGTSSPLAKLHVNSSTSLNLLLTSSIPTCSLNLSDSAATDSPFISGKGDDFTISTVSLERLRVLANGNVGIGTASPNHKLHLSVGNVDGIRVESLNCGKIEIGRTGGNRWMWANDYASSDSFELVVGASGAAPVNTVLTVKGGTGNVGIGTTNPLSKLDVNGGGRFNDVISLNAQDKAIVIGTLTTTNFAQFYFSSTNKALQFTNSLGANTLVIKDNTGNVGIGTSSPITKLHVYGGTFNPGDENSYAARFSSISDKGVVIGYRDSDNLGFIGSVFPGNSWTNTAINVFGGNVLIGTETDSTTAKLQVNGNASGSPATLGNHFVTLSQIAGFGGGTVNGTGSNGQVSFWTGTNSQSGDDGLFWNNTTKRLGIGTTSPTVGLHVRNSGVGGYISSQSVVGNEWITLSGNFPDPVFTWNNTGALRFGTTTDNITGGFVERMRIASGGNVGIGTTIPASKLTVNQLTGGDATYVGDIQINQLANAQSTDNNGGLEFKIDGGAAGYGKRIIGGFNGIDNYDLHFQTRFNTSTWSTNFIIKGNGNVGIGTSTPASKLNVLNNGTVIGISNATNGTNAVPQSRRLSWLTTNNAEAGYIDVLDSFSQSSGAPMTFATRNNSNVLSEKVRITHDGNVGIGTSTPLSKFHVLGGSFDSEDPNTYAARFSSTTNKGVVIGYRESGSLGFIGSIDPGNVWTNTAINAPGGNVLIGTDIDASGDKLQVNGTILATVIKKTGGLGTEYLMANGTTTTSTSASLQSAYNASISPQIVISNALTALAIKNNQTSDSFNTQTWQNNAGTIRAYITGNGDITCNRVAKTGGLATESIQASGDSLSLYNNYYIPTLSISSGTFGTLSPITSTYTVIGNTVTANIQFSVQSNTTGTVEFKATLPVNRNISTFRSIGTYGLLGALAAIVSGPVYSASTTEAFIQFINPASHEAFSGSAIIQYNLNV